ncbi:uncharacterized protein LOC126046136 [Accipiter gentilis]|uniref:uncharacterized protein LOC126046136 n=1 Tax=Astur gentilis TaxID=8957 RepID=UPI00210FD767|nr:uncharacterized protein LOC126046136 [Accipiter gentilis]
MGTPQMASGCVFLQGLGFLISKFSPKAASPCHASCVSAHASPAAHGQWGFAACIFSWSSPSSLLEWPTRSLNLQAPSHESSQQMLEHVMSQEGHFLHWLSSGKGNLQGRTSSLSFESHQEQERATSVCSETCLESELGQHAASLGAKQDAREQKETKYQTFSRRLCYINTSLGSGAHPGSWVNTPGQHYSIPVTLKPGEKLTICYCT